MDFNVLAKRALVRAAGKWHHVGRIATDPRITGFVVPKTVRKPALLSAGEAGLATMP